MFASTETAVIQQAIDNAAARGGGTVVVAPGLHVCGTIHLKSNVTMHLENGAILAASPDDADFASFESLPFESVSDKETTYFRYALIAAADVHDIAITGQGIIDGNRAKRGGPKTVALKRCTRVTIRDVTVRNSPNYSISMLGCDNVVIDGVTIANGYADGIDPDSCRNVRIANSYIDSWDDAICPKTSPSLGYARATENLAVTNCILRTNCNNFKFGTESSGDLKNVVVSNLTMLPRESGRPPISGISIEAVDGAHVDGVVISNVVMRGVRAPIFLRLGNRGRGLHPPVPGSLCNVTLSNVIATGALLASSITGLPGFPVRDIALSDVRISAEGGLVTPPSAPIPELPERYPEATMFGELPAYGLFARHVDGLTLRGVELRVEKPDSRKPIVYEDVRLTNPPPSRRPRRSSLGSANRD